MGAMSALDQKTDAIASVEKQFSTMYRHVRASTRRRACQVHPELQVMGYMILNTLNNSGPTHAGALVEILGIDKGLLSRQLRMLEEFGLIERESDPGDKRAVILTVSKAGTARMSEVRAADRAILYEQLRDWHVGDLEKLAELLARVNALDS
jgi:DNA-binding MarR family transcriptional regulator